MDYMVVISAIVLGLSVLATIAKFLDWFVHSDPKTMVRTTRWMLLLLLLAGLVLLATSIANEQWAVAMLIGAGMLVLLTLLKWRTMLAPLRGAFGLFRRRSNPFDMEVRDFDAARDPETVRRAAAILEAYVSKSSLVALTQQPPVMSKEEAIEVLGLEPGADEAAISAASQRLTGLVHPDRGGSAYLARKVWQAREVLLGPSRVWLPSAQPDSGPRSRAAKR
jgi:Zn-dependent protease with chaperone function